MREVYCMLRFMAVITTISVAVAAGAYHFGIKLGSSSLKDIRMPETKPSLPVVRPGTNEPQFIDVDALTKKTGEQIDKDMEQYYCTTNCPVEEPAASPTATPGATPSATPVATPTASPTKPAETPVGGDLPPGF